jgi:hypothetical protein
MESYVFTWIKLDYADEFDCEMFWAGSTSAYQDLQDLMTDPVDDGVIADNDCYFGTNEFLTIEPSDLVREMDAHKQAIEYGTFRTMATLFGHDPDKIEAFTYGTGSDLLETEHWKSRAGGHND